MITRRASGLIIANALIFIVATTAFFVLERILPVAAGTRGIENSNLAYYQAQAGVESAMMGLSRANAFLEPSATGGTSSVSYAAAARSLTPLVPIAGEGNSDYDQDWNKIGANDPVQLALPINVNWSNAKIFFRVPNLDGSGTTDETLSGAFYGTSSGIVVWSLTSDNGKFLNPVDESQTFRFTGPGGDVLSSATTPAPAFLNNLRQGRDQNSATQQFATFSSQASGADCNGASARCTLRFSVLRPLMTASGQTIPYLEYKMDFTTAGPSGVPVSVPDRFTLVQGRGTAFGFRRDIEKKVPQATAVQGLDVTVFN